MLRYRFLFEQMVRRELRQKYKGSGRLRCWTDDPDPALVAELLELVVHDDALRGELLSRGRARLDEYSPERTAEKVRAAVDAVIAR